MLTVDFPKASFSAMGFYGPIRVFDLSRDQEVINQLNNGKVHKKLKDKLTEKKITPAAVNPCLHQVNGSSMPTITRATPSLMTTTS